MKFQRNYQLDIFTPDGIQVTITPPLSIKFSITRNTLASANRAQIEIINLAKNTRNKIYKDRYSITEYWRIILRAGYGNKLIEVFSGNIYEAKSSKDKTEWTTSIDAFDGMDAIQNGFTSSTVAAGTSKENILKSVINDMPNVISGFFGEIADEEAAPRGKSLIGQSSDVLAAETDGQYFIDGETVNVLTDDEVIPGEILVLDASQNLATPKRQDTMLMVPQLFFPQAKVGLLCELNSLEEIYNGVYKIMGFTHNVTISQAVSGEARTEFMLYAGAAGFEEGRSV